MVCQISRLYAIIAIPSAGFSDRQRIIKRLAKHSLEVKTIPDLSSLIEGTKHISSIQDVPVDDLLGREAVKPVPVLMSRNILGKTVLVTGAGGSIGSELCRQIIRWQPSRLIILDQSEYAIYQLEQEIAAITEDLDIPLTPVVTSVLERAFISHTLTRYKVDTIYHAAAYKHVPLMEKNVMQGVKNNVFGTKTVAECAIEDGVRDFVLISTDKAVNPTNFMGTSKRLCELLCQSFNKTQDKTRFSMVRFGNVLGSSGSVIPLFKKQIEGGGPVTVTHKDITRYFVAIYDEMVIYNEMFGGPQDGFGNPPYQETTEDEHEEPYPYWDDEDFHNHEANTPLPEENEPLPRDEPSPLTENEIEEMRMWEAYEQHMEDLARQEEWDRGREEDR